jgi:site-specific DNA-methyltransferase (adenine-specific)
VPLVGQVYGTERVTLVQGDCLEVMQSLPDASIDAVVTDPPYLLGQASARKSADKVMGWADISNASVWYAIWFAKVWSLLKPAGCFWTFANWRSLPAFQCAVSKVPGMSFLSVLVWDKDWFSVGSMRGLRQQYELVVLMGKPNFTIRDRGLGDIWREKWSSRKPSGHPQEKPVPLLYRILKESGLGDGGIVLDPFTGSGTTGVACMQTGCHFLGIEIDPAYCAIARERLAKAELACVKQKET